MLAWALKSSSQLCNQTPGQVCSSWTEKSPSAGRLLLLPAQSVRVGRAVPSSPSSAAHVSGNSGVPQVKIACASRPVGTLVNRIIRPFLSPVPLGGPIVLVNDSAARRDGSTANTPTTAPCARSSIVSITRWPDLRSELARKGVSRIQALKASIPGRARP
jgi:hypothetical protein